MLKSHRFLFKIYRHSPVGSNGEYLYRFIFMMRRVVYTWRNRTLYSKYSFRVLDLKNLLKFQTFLQFSQIPINFKCVQEYQLTNCSSLFRWSYLLIHCAMRDNRGEWIILPLQVEYLSVFLCIENSGNLGLNLKTLRQKWCANGTKLWCNGVINLLLKWDLQLIQGFTNLFFLHCWSLPNVLSKIHDQHNCLSLISLVRLCLSIIGT